MSVENARLVGVSFCVRPWLVAGLLMASMFVGAASGVAQSSSATLTGVVLDTTGAVVARAELVLVHVDTSVQRAGVSDNGGGFVFTTLPPGRYHLRASLPGFAPVELHGIVLNVGDRVEIRVQLPVASHDEAVTVTAEARHISRSPAVGTVVDRQFAENLPLNGRSFQSLLELVPGVVQAGGTGQYSVNGQRSTANYFTIDGVSANAYAGTSTLLTAAGQLPAFTALGTTNSMLAVDMLQELRVQTSTYAPEFGRMPGGQVSMITRSGTNRFNGSVFDYFRHDAMDATDWFVNNRSLPKPRLRQHNFGGVIGGPIVRTRTFFFGSYEGLRLRQPFSAVANVPSIAARLAAPPVLNPYLNAFPVPNGRDLGSGVAEFGFSVSNPSELDSTSVRIDHNAGSSWKFFGRVSHAPSSRSMRSAPSWTISGLDADSITGGATWVMSSRAVNDLRVNYTTNSASILTYQDDAYGTVPLAPLHSFGPGRSLNDSLFSFQLIGCCAMSLGSALAYEQRQMNIVDSLVLTVAKHELKFGVDFRRSAPQWEGSGELTALLRVTPASLQAGRADALTTSLRDPSAHAALFDNLSLYAQDHWRLASRLTMTYGVRWEFVPPMRTSKGPQPVTLESLDDPYSGQMRLAPPGTRLWKKQYTNFAPRVGANYTLVDKPGVELILKGGFGLFHNLGFGNIGSTLTQFPFVSTVFVNSPVLPLAPELLLPEFRPDQPTAVVVADHNLQMPRTYQWNASVEQSIGLHQTFTVGYVGASGRRLLKIERYRINLVDSPTVQTLLSISRNRGYSDYHALQIQFQRRLHRGLQALGSYTWGRSRDTSSSDGATGVPAERLPPALDYGYSDFDLRHVLSAAVTYQMPTLSGGSVWRAFARDWGGDLMFRARSSYPIQVMTTVPFPPDSQAVRPNVVPGQPFWLEDSDAPGGRRLNRNAFVPPPPDTQGNLPRGAVRGFGARQVDAALRREFQLPPRLRLQLRFEMFNLLNTPQFLDPFGTLSDGPGFGRSTSPLNNSGGLSALYQLGGARSTQLAVKLLF